VLQLLTWTATGLIVGWIARTVMRSRRDFGLVGDLITGWLGGIVGGWAFRQVGLISPNNDVGHIVVAIIGAAVLLTGVRVLRHAMNAAHVSAPPAAISAIGDLEERIRRLSTFERGVFTDLLASQRWSRDPNQSFDAQTTFGERVADRVAQFGGSWTFIGLFGIVLIGWMALNGQLIRPFDPYPFILLNLVLSCLAALQAPIIMMSQNRQAAKDRSDAKNDYEVNIRAEMEIVSLHAKLDLLRDQQWLRLVEIVESQQRAVAAIERHLQMTRDAGSLDGDSDDRS
jgi:uncharacterized membrane protein/uncharacterized membrane protein YeaQ/YmgE (transglycosylase-associated protein family)